MCGAGTRDAGYHFALPQGFFQLGAECGMSSGSHIVFPEDVCIAISTSALWHGPTGRKAKD